MPSILQFAAKRVRKTKNCQKGYGCGNSCINKQRKCKKKFSDQASTYAGWLKKNAARRLPQTNATDSKAAAKFRDTIKPNNLPKLEHYDPGNKTEFDAETKGKKGTGGIFSTDEDILAIEKGRLLRLPLKDISSDQDSPYNDKLARKLLKYKGNIEPIFIDENYKVIKGHDTFRALKDVESDFAQIVMVDSRNKGYFEDDNIPRRRMGTNATDSKAAAKFRDTIKPNNLPKLERYDPGNKTEFDAETKGKKGTGGIFSTDEDILAIEKGRLLRLPLKDISSDQDSPYNDKLARKLLKYKGNIEPIFIDENYKVIKGHDTFRALKDVESDFAQIVMVDSRNKGYFENAPL